MRVRSGVRDDPPPPCLRRDESLQASLASRIPEPISGCHELYPHGQSIPKLPGPGFPLSNEGSAGGSQFDEPIVVDGPVDRETLGDRLIQGGHLLL